MVRFVVYNPNDGAIQRVGYCLSDVAKTQAGVGERVMVDASNRGDYTGCHVSHGVIRPPQ